MHAMYGSPPSTNIIINFDVGARRTGVWRRRSSIVNVRTGEMTSLNKNQKQKRLKIVRFYGPHTRSPPQSDTILCLILLISYTAAASARVLYCSQST